MTAALGVNAAIAPWVGVAGPIPVSTLDAAPLLEHVPHQLECKDLEIPSNGLDSVTEAQWSIVLEIAIDQGGRAAAYRLVKNPIDQTIEAEVTKALRSWKFQAPPSTVDLVRVLVVLPKALGSTQTSYCEHDSKSGPTNR